MSSTCQTCQGNGEVVTDWERYLHPCKGDVGDEAVEDCEDCSGYGVIPLPVEASTQVPHEGEKP